MHFIRGSHRRTVVYGRSINNISIWLAKSDVAQRKDSTISPLRYSERHNPSNRTRVFSGYQSALKVHETDFFQSFTQILILYKIFRFLAMAGKFEHLRHCLCGISAAHLRTATKSSQMVPLESHYRTLAIHGMVKEMQNLSRQSCDCREEISRGLIASSILMAWYSPNP